VLKTGFLEKHGNTMNKEKFKKHLPDAICPLFYTLYPLSIINIIPLILWSFKAIYAMQHSHLCVIWMSYLMKVQHPST
jgi:hypothetical protein